MSGKNIRSSLFFGEKMPVTLCHIVPETFNVGGLAGQGNQQLFGKKVFYR
jgi:hypothetical protein